MKWCCRLHESTCYSKHVLAWCSRLHESSSLTISSQVMLWNGVLACMRAHVIQNMYYRAGENTFFNMEYAKQGVPTRDHPHIYIYIYIYYIYNVYACVCIHIVYIYIYIYVCVRPDQKGVKSPPATRHGRAAAMGVGRRVAVEDSGLSN